MTAELKARDEALDCLRAWLLKRNPKLREADLGPDRDLVEYRVIDSLSFMEFILYIDELCGREILPSAVASAGVRTLRSICDTFFAELPAADTRGSRGPERHGAIAPDDALADQPLTHSQANWHYYDLDHPEGTSWMMPSLLRIRGPLETSRLTKALGELVRRHDGLRIRFKIGGGDAPRQSLVPPFIPDLPVTVIEKRRGEDPWAAALEAASQEYARPVDLEAGPPWRARLVRLATDDHLLVVTLSHILVDLEALITIPNQVALFYAALGTESSLASVPQPLMQYSQFAAWHRAWLKSAEGLAQIKHRREQFAGADTFSLGAPFTTRNTKEEDRRLIPLPVANRAEKLAAEERATSVVVGLSAYAAMLNRAFGHRDMSISLVLSFRTRETGRATTGVIGCFTNQQPLRISVDPKLSFRELVRNVRTIVIDAFKHRNVPTRLILDAQNPLDSPLAAVTFNWMNITDYADELVEIRSGDVLMKPIILGLDEPTRSLYGGIGKHTALTIRAVRTNRGVETFLATTVEVLGTGAAARLGGDYERWFRAATTTPDRALEVLAF